MPATVVIGGQYGSEGKGKVAHHLAAELDAAAVIRVGGPNSGHTSFAPDGSRQVLRQLPMAALLEQPLCLIGPGSYVDPAILTEEVGRLGLEPERVRVDFRAMAIAAADREAESRTGLRERIGSTCSGTGSAVSRRVSRAAEEDLLTAVPELHPFLCDTVELARELLEGGRRVVVEGTQGFGLSLLQSPFYPYVTSRDTTAAAALAEAGLSPRDVDDVTMVLRSHPIRVAGNSGPFDAAEIDWETVSREGELDSVPSELTSVTGRERRVARFDPGIVNRAIAANRPSRIVLNHLDYIDGACTAGTLTPRALAFVCGIESAISRPIDLLGCGPRPQDLITQSHDSLLRAP